MIDELKILRDAGTRECPARLCEDGRHAGDGCYCRCENKSIHPVTFRCVDESDAEDERQKPDRRLMAGSGRPAGGVFRCRHLSISHRVYAAVGEAGECRDENPADEP